MKTINDYLDAYAAARGITSDYAIAKDLGVTRQAVSRYRNEIAAPDLDITWRIAEAIGVPPAEVIAAGEIQRAKFTHNDERARVWARRLRDLSAALSVVFIGFFGMMAAAPAGAVTAVRCILCQIDTHRQAAHRHRRRATLIRSKMRQYLDFFAIVRGTQYAKLF